MNRLPVRQQLAALLIIWALLSACSPLKPINVEEVEDFRVTSIDKKKAHVELLVPVDNQNVFGFKITDVDIDVKANGLYLGKITNTEGIKFKADTRSIYRFPLDVQFDLNVLLNPKLYATLLSNRAELQLKGYIKVRAFLIISTKIEVDQTEQVKIINI